MRTHDYHLQALLYGVALHRHLRSCLPDYRYDDHFGGSLYLFVRGVRPGWVDADGNATGVVFDRPPQALIEALSALLERPASPRGAAVRQAPSARGRREARA